MKTIHFITACMLLSTALLQAQKPVPKGAYQLLTAQYGDPYPLTAEERGVIGYKLFVDGYWLAMAGKRGSGKFDYACGGFYNFRDGKYHEFIDFASYDSTLAGDDILFDYTVEGPYYRQIGAFPNGDVIDEMLLSVSKSDALINDGLEGVWFLERATWGNSSFDPEKNASEVAMKIYAFPIVAYGYWNKKTSSFIGAGAGRYQFDGKTLTEHVGFSTWHKPGALISIDVSMGENTYEQQWSGQNREMWRKAKSQVSLQDPSHHAELVSHNHSKKTLRANEGDHVWLIVNHVKAESRQAFEKFMDDVFFDILANSTNPVRKEQYRKLRWLVPAAPNEDGTWPYAFIMDPVIPGTDYDIQKLFEDKYNPEKAAELMRQYESFIAGGMYKDLLQTKH